MANFNILNIPDKVTSWDKGKTWHPDPNIHLTSGGKSYYVKAGQDPSNPQNWNIDTMAGFHRTADPEPTPESEPVVDLPTLTPDIYPKSESGIDFNANELLSSIKGLLEEQVPLIPERASELGSALQAKYSNLMKRVAPQAFQGTLNNLASRNILDSSIASDTLANIGTGLAENVGDQAYDSYLQGLLSEMNVPTQLSTLAQLGQRSTSENPLAPYTNFLLQLLL